MVVEQARVIIVLKKLDQKMLEEDEIMIYMMVDMLIIDLGGGEDRSRACGRQGWSEVDDQPCLWK